MCNDYGNRIAYQTYVEELAHLRIDCERRLIRMVRTTLLLVISLRSDHRMPWMLFPEASGV